MIEAAAQAFVFFAAGFETTSSTATYSLLELALNPECQQKLQEEIDQFTNNSQDITYENILKMEYLDMVFKGKFFIRILYFCEIYKIVN